MKYRIKETTRISYTDNGTEEGEKSVFTRFWPQYRYGFWPFWFAYTAWENYNHNYKVNARFDNKIDAEQFIRDEFRKARIFKKNRIEVKHHSFNP